MAETFVEPRLAVPDPTPATSERLLREVSSLEALLNEKIANVVTQMCEKNANALEQISALDRAQQVFHADLVRVPTAMDKAVEGLKELHEAMFTERLHAMEVMFTERFNTMSEKFDSIAIQFKERDERVKQTALDNTTAINAAFAAQEKGRQQTDAANARATEKSEETFTKQIDQQRQLLDVTTRGFNERIEAVKEMLYRGEGRDSGKSSSFGTMLAVLATAVSIVALGVTILKLT